MTRAAAGAHVVRHDLAGAAEAAEVLGMRPPHVNRARKDGRMPPLVARLPDGEPLAMGPVWFLADIRAMAVTGSRGQSDWGSTRVLPLLGTAEVATLLGKDKSQIGRWRRADVGFPEPYAVLRAGPLWLVQDVEEWARRRT